MKGLEFLRWSKQVPSDWRQREYLQINILRLRKEAQEAYNNGNLLLSSHINDDMDDMDSRIVEIDRKNKWFLFSEVSK